jgi:hypothetical protein
MIYIVIKDKPQYRSSYAFSFTKLEQGKGRKFTDIVNNSKKNSEFNNSDYTTKMTLLSRCLGLVPVSNR